MAEPVSLAEARAQVNIIDDADTTFDTFLTSLIAAARAYVERVTRYYWVAGSRSQTFDAWGDFIEIYRHGVTAVGPDITYTDEDGNDATYSDFEVALGQFPVRISPAIDGEFPTLGEGGQITVPFTVAALSDTSEEYLIGKRAMLLLIGHWFEYRESVTTQSVAPEIAFTVRSLLDELRPLSAY